MDPDDYEVQARQQQQDNGDRGEQRLLQATHDDEAVSSIQMRTFVSPSMTRTMSPRSLWSRPSAPAMSRSSPSAANRASTTLTGISTPYLGFPAVFAIVDLDEHLLGFAHDAYVLATVFDVHELAVARIPQRGPQPAHIRDRDIGVVQPHAALLDDLLRRDFQRHADH